MHALPFLLALASAAILAPAVLRGLNAGGHTRANYRKRPLPFPFGMLALAASLIALIPLMLLHRLASTEVFHPEALPIAVYALGVLALGLIDDTLAEARSEEANRPVQRGLRGHGAAALRGELSTGALKAAGSLGLALFAMSYLGLSDDRWLLAAAVLVLATNLFNLLDLRPGRSTKAFVLLGVGLVLGSAEVRPLWALGLFAGPALVAGVYDLRERAMLGDTGASLLGALAGLWLVLTLSPSGQLVALALLAAVTLYGELRSISELIERTPVLRALDAWGRP
jgi:UDP-GlcNAc:undecaprenyl-phosphate/decaprenyl-phosphate GlcNAc-1-phosphate transferase